MERLTNITPIDEYYDDMSKEDVYNEYFDTWQSFDLALKQFDDLESALRIAMRNQEKIKVKQVLEILEMQKRERHELLDNQLRDKEVVIVCREHES